MKKLKKLRRIQSKRNLIFCIRLFSSTLELYSICIIINLILNKGLDAESVNYAQLANKNSLFVWSTFIAVSVVNMCWRLIKRNEYFNTKKLYKDVKRARLQTIFSGVVVLISTVFGKIVLNSEVFGWIISRLWIVLFILNLCILKTAKRNLKYAEKRGNAKSISSEYINNLLFNRSLLLRFKIS